MFGNMKVNFNQFFKNYRGELLTVDNKPQSMKMVIAQSLFNGEGMKPTNDTLKDGEKKNALISVVPQDYGERGRNFT